MNKFVLYGAGGHAKVVADVLVANGFEIYTFIDSRKSGRYLGIELNKSILTCNEILNKIIAIGDNAIRKKIAESLSPTFGLAKHKSAEVSASVHIEEGCMVLHQAVVQAGSKIGKHVIINTRASVDHDCVIDDFVHVAPGSILCGNVKVGEGTLVGAGTTVIPNITIGKWCIIGAGSVIIKDVPDYSVVVGNPGRIIKSKQNG